MKKTAWKDALRNIRSRFVSWLSMVSIVLIGTSVILGLFFSYRSLSVCGNNYIDDHGFKDMTIACSLGVQEEDMENFREIEGIKDVEGVMSFPCQISFGNKNSGAMIVSATERISVPYVFQGELPDAENECAINPGMVSILNASIGDEITVAVTTPRLANTLKNEKFIITGIVGHPDYMTKAREEFCVLPRSAFDTSKSAFDFTNVVVKTAASDIMVPTDRNYSKDVNEVRMRVEDNLEPLSKKRLDNLAKDLDKEYANAESEVNKKLAEGKSQIDAAQKEFDEKIGDAWAQIADGEKELNEGKAKAERELAAAKKKIDDGEKEFNEKIADGERQLAEGEKKMEEELANGKWLLFDGMLQIDKNEQLLKAKEEEYRQGVEKYSNGLDKISAARTELDNGWSQYNDGLSKIDGTITPSAIKEVADDLADLGSTDAANALYEVADREPLERAEGVLAVYEEYVIVEIKDLIEELFNLDDFRDKLSQLRDAKTRLDNGEAQYWDGIRQLEDAKQELEDGRRQLDSGWFSLQEARKKLAEGEAEYARKEPEARAQLAAKKAEFEQKKAEGAKELEDGKKLFAAKKKEVMEEIALHEKELQEGKEEFEKQKAEGEAKLKDAWDQYYKGKQEAEEKLAEVRDQINEAKSMDCRWFVQTLDANISFMEYKSYCDILLRVCLVFAPIYSAIVVIVCFFTMAIIVEEQAKQTGTCKALGMYKSEIRMKYLLFGFTASVFGAVLGIGGAMAFEHMISNSLATTFVFGYPAHVFDILPLLIVPLGAAAVTTFSVFWSSEKVLSCSAVGLVSGNEPAKRTMTKAKKNDSGSVYARLIVNNFVMDLGRETVSIVIILACCMLIGLGTTIKLGHAGAMNNQVYNIHEYDINMTLASNITDEEREKILEAIKDYDYLPVAKLGGVIQNSEGQTLTELYCTDDQERFRQFFGLKTQDGADVEIPDDGMLVSYEMGEKNGLKIGSKATIIIDDLSLGEPEVKGHFLLHVGKTAVMSFNYYKELFDSEPKINDYMIKVGNGNVSEAEERLSELSGVAEISKSTDLLEEKAGMSRLYTIVVIVVIAFSIFLSFMILLNLSNILVAHRMKELLTMRVNGFPNSSVIGYLVREVLVTTMLGLLLGLLIGVPSTNMIIHNIESNGFMFLRKVYVAAWALAVGCNLLFAVVINSLAFRKVGKVPLTDITRY